MFSPWRLGVTYAQLATNFLLVPGDDCRSGWSGSRANASFGTISYRNENERLTNLFLSACVESGSQVVVLSLGPKKKNLFYMIWGVTGPSCFPHKRAFPTSEGPYPKVANLPLI